VPRREPPPRRAGSTRFAPYYKVQTWDARGLTWRDVQRQHAAFPAGQRCRLVEVTMHGRRPLPESGG
jgi:hypothetical protein